MSRILIVIALVCAHTAEICRGAERPNVIVVLVDDMGWSDLGCYGGEISTPNIDALAAGGVRFTQFYNTARCCPTRAALLTGVYQHQAGIGHMVANDGIPSYQGFLNDRCVTIAEAIRPAGYTTLMAGKWHVGSERGHWPLDRGFDRFWGTPSGGGVYFRESQQIRKEVFFASGNDRVEFPEGEYVTDLFTTQALGFLDEAVGAQQPFFLYLAHIAPHWPLQAKPNDIARYSGRYAVGWDEIRQQRFERQQELGVIPADARLSPRDSQAHAWEDLSGSQRDKLAQRMEIYAAQVDCIDQNIGRLVAKLKELDQFENTLILFLSDNGCSAEGGPGGFSRGKPEAPIGTGLSYASVGLEWANVSDTPYRKFKIHTYEGGISTPLIAHWPAGMAGSSLAGSFIHEPGHVIDLLPTVLDVAGASYPTERNGISTLPPEGRSLKPLLTGTTKSSSETQERPLFWEHEGNRAVRLGRWKAVAQKGNDWELYDLSTDRAEERNLASGQPKKTQELVALWQAWADRAGVWDWDTVLKRRRQRQKGNMN